MLGKSRTNGDAALHFHRDLNSVSLSLNICIWLARNLALNPLLYTYFLFVSFH